MFYLFSSISMIIMAFSILSSVLALGFTMAPCLKVLDARVGDAVFVSRSWCGAISRSQALLAAFCIGVVVSWMITGHWLLNNILGISLCIAFVSHVRLPNIKVCALVLVGLFVYDIFWVFFSEQFFGSNVMVTVATRQTSNPVHTVASSLNMQKFSEVVAKKLDMPLKLIFPRSLWDVNRGNFRGQYLMIGLGDLAIPGMLLSLVLCFDHRKVREHDNEGTFSRGNKYIQYGGGGYAVGMVAALSAGLLSQAAQPALLYLVPSTLGAILSAAWARGELAELWSGPRPIVTEKTSLVEP
jgi:signal peptide peptidase-like protein 3